MLYRLKKQTVHGESLVVIGCKERYSLLEVLELVNVIRREPSVDNGDFSGEVIILEQYVRYSDGVCVCHFLECCVNGAGL
jgi:hypothetical protein